LQLKPLYHHAKNNFSDLGFAKCVILSMQGDHNWTMKNPEVLEDMRVTDEPMMIFSNSLDTNETPCDTASHCNYAAWKISGGGIPRNGQPAVCSCFQDLVCCVLFEPYCYELNKVTVISVECMLCLFDIVQSITSLLLRLVSYVKSPIWTC